MFLPMSHIVKETRQDSDEHNYFAQFVLFIYDKSEQNVFTIAGENCIVNQSFYLKNVNAAHQLCDLLISARSLGIYERL